MVRSLLLLTLFGLAACKSPQKSAPTPVPDEDVASAVAHGDPAMPGVAAVDEALDAKLQKALAARGKDYKPRTHHLEEGGAPKFTNRLILETSPYLLQHAHNPVNWFPWGDEAFDRAANEDKPVLLSVGYSTCHWCHVMEVESFEDEEIAAYINAHFIPVKVDREERPDVDDIYMKAVNLLAGRGGWPMTVVMTPQREPFFGGTYFPARDGDRGTRKGFFTILKELQQKYATDPKALVAEAKSISERIRKMAEATRPGDVPGPEAVESAAAGMARRFDPQWGGFGRAPKFPQPAGLEFLLRYHRRTGDPHALQMVVTTLEKMAAGGIYDHIGGGFHRYSTDGRWFAPHFEKMLYDNAQLAVVYLNAYQVTGHEAFAGTTTEILDYVAREMTGSHGGFYSATDADSLTPEAHLEEGYFFTWSTDELREVLGEEAARVAIAYWGATDRGNFEKRNILHTPRSDEEVAAEFGITVEKLRQTIEEVRPVLYEARKKHAPPLRGDKVLVSWNGLMISAFAQAGLILERADYVNAARGAAQFVLDNLRDDRGRLLRSHMDGRARHNAYLDDYAFFIQGLLDLFETTQESRWLEVAVELQQKLDVHYLDAAGGGYYMTSDDHEKLLARDKPAYDGAEPSGNSVALMNLLRLHEFTGGEPFQKQAEKNFAAFAGTLAGGGSTKMLSALEFYLDAPLEILIVAAGSTESADPLLDEVRKTYLPNRIVAVSADGASREKLAKMIPLLESKFAIDGKTTAFVCEKGRCELPTSDPDVFGRQIGKVHPLRDDKAAKPLATPAPAATPTGWQYDEKTNRHWHPGHQHWHDGPPPVP